MKNLLKKIIYKTFEYAHTCYWNIKYQNYKNKYSISDNFKFNGHYILFYGDGIIKCGKNSYIGSFSTIQAEKNCKVIIGNNVRISHNVRIYTSNNIADQDFSSPNLKKHLGNVIIEDNVWIGVNVFIKQGVTIGANTVVGANSVVINDLEPNCIYAGNPAKLIKKKTGIDI